MNEQIIFVYNGYYLTVIECNLNLFLKKLVFKLVDRRHFQTLSVHALTGVLVYIVSINNKIR